MLPVITSSIYMFYWGRGEEAVKQLQDSAVARVPGAKLFKANEGPWIKMLLSVSLYRTTGLSYAWMITVSVLSQ